MEQVFDVYAEGVLMGEICMYKNGLYYGFDCRIYPHEQGKYRLIAQGEDQKYDFGIFIPWENGLRIRTQIPIKNFIKGNVTFEAVKDLQNSGDLFVPIYEEKPFAYLHMLESSMLMMENGKLGIYVRV